MKPVVIRRAAARRDLVDIFDYYVETATIRTPRRFVAQAEATFQRLARLPSFGALYKSDDPIHPGLRFMPVSRFRKDLVFYIPIPGGIEVLRVRHGVRDY